MLFIPSSIKVLNKKAFYSNCYNQIILEEGVTNIGDECFGYCDFLEEITLPSSTSEFGKNVFTCCQNLSEITVAEDNAVLSADENTLYNKDKTKILWVSSTLTEYTIIESVTEIPTALFRGSRTLKSVTINADLEWLPCSTFMECISLTTVTINGVIENVAGLYDNPDAIDDPNMPGYVDTSNYGAFMVCQQLSSISFPEGLKYIGKAAFSRCSSLTAINLPASVETIADDAFWTQPIYGKLTTLTLTGNENENFILDKNACLIRKGTAEEGNTVILWANGSNIADYVVPNGVKNIVPAAFMRSPNLVSVTIPEGVTEIPAACFFYCPNLTTVTLPTTLTKFVSEYEIKYGAHDISGFNGSFELCEALSTINLQDTALTEIGGRAFYGCGISEINLPSTTIEIESNAFYNCPIESFAVETNNQQFATDSKSLYTVDGVLLYFAVAYTQIAEYSVPDTINTIKEYAFYQHKLTEVTLPNSVTLIEQGAFESFTENFEGEYSLTWYQYTIEFLGVNPPQLEGLNPLSAEVDIKVPENAFKAYYIAFFGIGYEEMIDDSLIAKTTFVFNANGGTAVNNIVDVCIKSMPITNWDGEGQKYFHGWFTDDGVWQQEIFIPYFYEGEGNTVTLYAKWGDEKREDGSCELFAFELSSTMRPITLDNGTYYFTFTVSGFGLYDIQATLTLFDYITAYTVYDQQGFTELPYFYMEDTQMKLTVIITIDGLEQPTEFEMGIINQFA